MRAARPHSPGRTGSPSEHTVHQHSAAEGSGSSSRTWQRRPQRKTGAKIARGARYGAKAPERQQALTAYKSKQCVAVRAGYGYVTVISHRGGCSNAPSTNSSGASTKALLVRVTAPQVRRVAVLVGVAALLGRVAAVLLRALAFRKVLVACVLCVETQHLLTPGVGRFWALCAVFRRDVLRSNVLSGSKRSLYKSYQC